MSAGVHRAFAHALELHERLLVVLGRRSSWLRDKVTQ
jgi:hypothetical protein